eukprot:13016-Heterococcus_DN1.PRE.1
MYIWVPMFEVALDDSIHIEGGRTDSPGETSALPRLYCCVVAVHYVLATASTVCYCYYYCAAAKSARDQAANTLNLQLLVLVSQNLTDA